MHCKGLKEVIAKGKSRKFYSFPQKITYSKFSFFIAQLTTCEE